MGRTDDALHVLRTLEAVAGQSYMPPYAIALVHAGLGDNDAAFDWLERAVEAHDVHLAALPSDAKWDGLRGDAKFAEVLRRCGLPYRSS